MAGTRPGVHDTGSTATRLRPGLLPQEAPAQRLGASARLPLLASARNRGAEPPGAGHADGVRGRTPLAAKQEKVRNKNSKDRGLLDWLLFLVFSSLALVKYL